MASVDSEKEWRGLKLTPIVENDDGSNNYAEFRAKSKYKLDAAGYWKYIEGDEYKPPTIPKLVESETHTGFDTAGNEITITTRGNEVEVNVARKNAEAWLAMDKKALAIIVEAVPMAKLYVVDECKSAREAWNALKEAYEPTNTLTAVTLKGQISSFMHMCGAGNPVAWRVSMMEMYQRLRRADPAMLSDHEFAKCLVSNMSQSDKWQFCRDFLLEQMTTSEQGGKPLSSAFVIARLQREEVSKGLFATTTSPSKARKGGGGTEDDGSAVASASFAQAQTNSQGSRKGERAHQRNERRPGPYDRRGTGTPAPNNWRPRVVCENTYCMTPVGHVQADCFSYQGGKAGQYPDSYKGNRDIHLSPEERIAERRRQALQGAGDRFAGMVDVTEDNDDEILDAVGNETVDANFAFMLGPLEVEGECEEEIWVNALDVAMNAAVEQTNNVYHDTGASRHVFNSILSFHEYEAFKKPLSVHGFGTNLTTQALGKGRIILEGTHDGDHKFSLSSALHIPSARCNLVSGTQLDLKGVQTETGGGRISYFNSEGVPFASGEIVGGLYKMGVKIMETAPNLLPSPTLINATTPSATAILGPDADLDSTKEAVFSTV